MGRYVELRCKSAFSFLTASSDPEDLVDAAADLGMGALALADRDGLYGAPRFYQAAREAGIRPLVGADLTLDSGGSLLVLVKSQRGYRNLCRLLTLGHRDRSKGLSQVSVQQVAEHADGLLCLTGQVLEQALARGEAQPLLERLKAVFGPRDVWVEVSRHLQREDGPRNQALVELAERAKLEVVATNDVRCARLQGRQLLDVMTCIREKVLLDRAGRLLLPNGERYLKTERELGPLFAHLPRAMDNTLRVAERCEFTLENLGYRFPDYPVPSGETQFGFLHHLVQEGARGRYRPLAPRHVAQLARELSVIAKLELSGYFLVVWDICRFCRERGILVQGRGSAANSAVCYVLGITAVDPVGMELLFERFLCEERGHWPDIDLDLPSGDHREEVIQYVYQRYGRQGAAMTANVITYRRRSAVREVGKVLGMEEERLARMLAAGYGGGKELASAAEDAGLDLRDRWVALLLSMASEIQHLPRHLGQHSGGMVIAASRLDEVVPLEPASMPGRTVIQWDKDDCADLGIIKVDLLGLGMMRVLEEALPLIKAHQGVEVDLAHLPQDDPKVYAMLQRADTIGVFQVESRAQMATLPRMKPRCFYDLVVEVAIIRPGPIVGKKVHPYLNRRSGREPVTYAHPLLEPILKRTLGIALFQEQAMRIAMEAAGFSPRQADELRRAMGHKRSLERQARQEQALRQGMKNKGIEGEAADEILESLGSFFGLYGFPESHAASFALIVYASAYLKAHHPAAFLCALLNAWPMGFYQPATLIQDAKRHGQTVREIDVCRSGWRCRIEPDGGVRLGLRFVSGLRQEAGLRIEAAQGRGLFVDLHDFQRRCPLRANELSVLGELGAFGGLGLRRRDALWQIAALDTSGKGLLERLAPDETVSPLPQMRAAERTEADLRISGMTCGPHLMAHFRAALVSRGVLPAASLEAARDGSRVRVAGVVITRQRPQTARGMCFLTLEDESGLANVAITPERFERDRLVIASSAALVVQGLLQRRDGVIHLLAEQVAPLESADKLPPSRDFR